MGPSARDITSSASLAVLMVVVAETRGLQYPPVVPEILVVMGAEMEFRDPGAVWPTFVLSLLTEIQKKCRSFRLSEIIQERLW